MGTSTVNRSQIAGTIKYLVEPYSCCINGQLFNICSDSPYFELTGQSCNYYYILNCYLYLQSQVLLMDNDNSLALGLAISTLCKWPCSPHFELTGQSCNCYYFLNCYLYFYDIIDQCTRVVDFTENPYNINVCKTLSF